MIRQRKYTYLTSSLALIVLGSGTNVHACSWFNPCKPAIHHAKKAKPNPAILKYGKNLDAHERRLAVHDAQFKSYAAAIGALQRQITELKSK